VTDIVSIPFHGGEVLSTLVDGKPYVVLRPALDRLGMDYSTQLKKLRRRSWAVMGQSPTAGSDGKTYQMVTVDVRTFIMLLATIDEHRVAEEVRPLLVAYQSEMADVLEAYWSDGGVINPRATVEQLDTIASRAEAQMRVLRLADGIIDPHWLDAKARHVVARALGEEPELDPEFRPLSVGEYLNDRGITGAELRTISPTFGKRLKTLYRAEHFKDPGLIERFVDGALRMVSGYVERDRKLFDQIWDDYYAGMSH
jgi:hypothetical protein